MIENMRPVHDKLKIFILDKIKFRWG